MSTPLILIIIGSVAIILVAAVLMKFFPKTLAKISLHGALLVLLGVCLMVGAEEIAKKAREIRDKLP